VKYDITNMLVGSKVITNNVFLLFGADPDLDLQTIEFKFMQF
jgi:hypothetical protein